MYVLIRHSVHLNIRRRYFKASRLANARTNHVVAYDACVARASEPNLANHFLRLIRERRILEIATVKYRM